MAAPKGNKNAEKWDLKTATAFMQAAVSLSENDDYDFIGEIAKDLKQDKGTFDYLCEKFPTLRQLKNRILSNCEANCFRNGKNEKINTALAIVNLKSNHGWTDRSQTDITTNGKPLNLPPYMDAGKP